MEFLSDELREELESFVAIFEETEHSESDGIVQLKLEIFPSDWFSKSCLWINKSHPISGS